MKLTRNTIEEWRQVMSITKERN